MRHDSIIEISQLVNHSRNNNDMKNPKNNSLIFVFAFLIPLVMMFIGFYTDNIDMATKGFFLMVGFYAAFVGASTKDLLNIKVSKKRLSIFIVLFVLSIGAIIYTASIGKWKIGSIFSLVTGLAACFILLYQKKEE